MDDDMNGMDLLLDVGLNVDTAVVPGMELGRWNRGGIHMEAFRSDLLLFAALLLVGLLVGVGVCSASCKFAIRRSATRWFACLCRC